MKIITDKDKIEDFLTRGVSALYPNKEFIRSRLLSGEQLSVYLGIDPTGPTLHIGHIICLMKLSEFQKLGHKVILLIGSFTGMIGDPTDKSATRKQLTREDVLLNCEKYKKQASTFLNFEGENPVELRYNSEWHDKLTFKEVVEIASRFTVSQMIERDMFQERIKNNQAIGLHEFLYPLMQGYDSVAMNVDGEIGGNDQIFNMLCGRDLMKDLKNKEKFVIGMKLLVDPTGKKMGKSEGNMISLIDSSKDMFGKIMSWGDEMIFSGFELCTNVSNKDINEKRKELESGKNPRDIKLDLAYNIVRIYHGDDVAMKEKENFLAQFSDRQLPKDIEEVFFETTESKIVELLVFCGLVSSKTEARQMIEQGAVKIYYKEKDVLKISDVNYLVSIEDEMVLQVGKLRFKKIFLKKVFK